MIIKLFFYLATAWAQVGTTTDALGGASIGNSHPLDSVWTNPAGIAAAGGVFGSVQYFHGAVATDSLLTQYGLTITDGVSGAFPGALGYRRRVYEVAGDRVNEHIYRFAAAVPLKSNLVVGLSGYRVHTDTWQLVKTNQDNVDLGILWMPLPRLRLGALTRAVMGAKDNIYAPSRVVPSGGVGAKFLLLENVAFYGDLNYGYQDIGTGKRLQTQMGVEFVNPDGIAVRAGFENDDWRSERKITAGIGWDGPKLRVGYSYQKETRAELGESHTVDIWLAF